MLWGLRKLSVIPGSTRCHWPLLPPKQEWNQTSYFKLVSACATRKKHKKNPTNLSRISHYYRYQPLDMRCGVTALLLKNFVSLLNLSLKVPTHFSTCHLGAFIKQSTSKIVTLTVHSSKRLHLPVITFTATDTNRNVGLAGCLPFINPVRVWICFTKTERKLSNKTWTATLWLPLGMV